VQEVEMPVDELEAWLRLLLTPGVGRVQARRLLAAAGSPQAVFELGHAALQGLGLERCAAALAARPAELDGQLHATLNWLEGAGDRFVFTLGDAGYAPQLLDIDDPPLLLYAMGALAQRWAAGEHGSQPMLAVVGSRNPTPQGQRHAQQFAHALAQAGVCIVSGLALGIDGAAHQGAMQAGGSTVAVVGTGLDRVYPRQHLALARQMLDQGAIVSEFAIGAAPLNHHFPQRNRILAGLAQATLVVEANLQSGSLITARLAAEQGKEVMAIPGSIDSPQSRGCHQLIVQGARLVGSVAEVLQALDDLGVMRAATVAPAADPPGQPPEPDLPPGRSDDGPLLRALGFEPVGLDALQARCGWPTERLQARLLELELAGALGRLPGGLFQRLA
jgi:DNA processing protein